MFDNFESAEAAARRRSRECQCTVHVNAQVRMALMDECGVTSDQPFPTIIGYLVSDWYNSDATVQTWHYGNLLESRSHV